MQNAQYNPSPQGFASTPFYGYPSSYSAAPEGPALGGMGLDTPPAPDSAYFDGKRTSQEYRSNISAQIFELQRAYASYPPDQLPQEYFEQLERLLQLRQLCTDPKQQPLYYPAGSSYYPDSSAGAPRGFGPDALDGYSQPFRQSFQGPYPYYGPEPVYPVPVSMQGRAHSAAKASSGMGFGAPAPAPGLAPTTTPAHSSPRVLFPEARDASVMKDPFSSAPGSMSVPTDARKHPQSAYMRTPSGAALGALHASGSGSGPGPGAAPGSASEFGFRYLATESQSRSVFITPQDLLLICFGVDSVSSGFGLPDKMPTHIGKYNFNERATLLNDFLQARSQRQLKKKCLYEARRRIACERARIGGRFVKQDTPSNAQDDDFAGSADGEYGGFPRGPFSAAPAVAPVFGMQSYLTQHNGIRLNLNPSDPYAAHHFYYAGMSSYNPFGMGNFQLLSAAPAGEQAGGQPGDQPLAASPAGAPYDVLALGAPGVPGAPGALSALSARGTQSSQSTQSTQNTQSAAGTSLGAQAAQAAQGTPDKGAQPSPAGDGSLFSIPQLGPGPEDELDGIPAAVWSPAGRHRQTESCLNTLRAGSAPKDELVSHGSDTEGDQYADMGVEPPTHNRAESRTVTDPPADPGCRRERVKEPLQFQTISDLTSSMSSASIDIGSRRRCPARGIRIRCVDPTAAGRAQAQAGGPGQPGQPRPDDATDGSVSEFLPDEELFVLKPPS